MHLNDPPDKPFLSYNDLLEKMSSRNIIIDNQALAIEILKSISYYQIVNGYKACFTENQNYPRTIMLTELYTLHSISSELSNSILRYLLIVERSLKTKLSYTVAKNFGVMTDLSIPISTDEGDYLSKRHYNNPSKSGKNLRDATIRRIKEYNKKSSLACAKHYQKTKNHIPPWVAINSIPLGLAVNWYSILKGPDKTEIAENFFQYSNLSQDSKKRFLRKSLLLLRCYRNYFAHNNNVIGVMCEDKIPEDVLKKIVNCSNFDEITNFADITAMLLSLVALINNPYELRALYMDLHRILYDYTDLTICDTKILDLLGFRPNSISTINNFIIHRLNLLDASLFEN